MNASMRGRSGRHRTGLSETQEEAAVQRAVAAVLRSAEAHGLRTISIERAYEALIKQTTIIDDCRLWWGDKRCMRELAEQLAPAAAELDIIVTK